MMTTGGNFFSRKFDVFLQKFVMRISLDFLLQLALTCGKLSILNGYHVSCTSCAVCWLLNNIKRNKHFAFVRKYLNNDNWVLCSSLTSSPCDCRKCRGCFRPKNIVLEMLLAVIDQLIKYDIWLMYM